MYKIQKKFIRIITFSPFKAHTQPLFVANQMLDLFDINNYMTAVFMYNALCSENPNIFSSFYVRNSGIHEHGTRIARNLYVPFAKKCIRRFSMRIHGACVWNEIPGTIRNAATLPSFKTLLKKFYIERQISIATNFN